jgi:titin
VAAYAGTTLKAAQVVAGDARQTSLTGLANGTAYDVVVVPYVANGAGSPSTRVRGTPSAAAPANSPAGAVRDLAASPGRRFATVTWAPPADDGGTPVAVYSVLAINHATGALMVWRNVGADVRAAAVPDLTAGVVYDVYVVAATAVGFGVVALAVQTTPLSSGTVAQAPTTTWVSAIPAGSVAVVTWGPPVERGNALTHVNVVVIQGGVMTAWTVIGPDQRQVSVPLGANGPAEVYLLAQSSSGYGPLSPPVSVSRAA